MKEYYHGSDIIKGEFLQFPLVLLKSEKYQKLNSDAMVLYAILSRRLRLSLRNGWTDENNRIYIYYSREEMASDLRVSLPTVRKAVKLLIESDLLEEKRQGLTKANMLYLLKPNIEMMEECFSGNEETNENFQQSARLVDFQSEKSFQSRQSERNFQQSARLSDNSDSVQNENKLQSIQKDSFSQEGNNIATKEIYSSKQYSSEQYGSIYIIPSSSSDELKSMMNMIKENIDYDSLSDSEHIGVIDSVIDIIIGVLTSSSKRLRIGHNYYDIKKVQDTFMKVNKHSIEHTVDAVIHSENIKNMTNYIISVLFNYLSNPIKDTVTEKSYDEWKLEFYERIKKWSQQ